MRLWPIAILAITAMVGGASNAEPQSTSSTIKIVVPFSPGASNDVIARAIAVPLGQKLNVPVIVENKAGAAGVIPLHHA